MPLTILPRFSEVDVLGHVTNTALPVWFEEGRQEIFRHFSREARQQAFQFEALVATGRCVMVHFDYTANASRAIDAEQRRALSGLFTEEYAQRVQAADA